MFYAQSGLTSLDSVTRFIALSLVNAGFTVTSVDGAPASSIPAALSSVTLSAATSVDPYATAQPWSMWLHATDNTLDAAVLPTANFVDYVPPVVGAGKDAENKDTNIRLGVLSRHGFDANHFIDLEKSWMLVPDLMNDVGETHVDGESYPLSVFISVTNHGIALCVWAESVTNLGTAFSWFVAQRPVSNLGAVLETSPLVCVFSSGGGVDGNPDVLDPDGIQMFTVIEQDIGAATFHKSAVTFGPDSVPVINPLQQVALTRENKVLVFVAQSYNTARHVFPMQLDMLAYTSADVLSAGSQQNIKFAFSPSQIPYIALNANGKDQRGMRVLFPKQ